ncbi:Myb-binding protein 1A-like protein [Liparis tanakae]|uniref:Myb-binding protein 1A-like protein n=1 Tax=Liparis tanakae TaxID=230148 RepID=A0A4Z2EHC5_9TELE|nr:Myb-binding protein 1A-like protein [Liparis tanakae]
MSVEMAPLSVTEPGPVKPTGVLQQNRLFLDFFWDLAKPDQAVRLRAVEELIRYLETSDQVSGARREARGASSEAVRGRPLINTAAAGWPHAEPLISIG